MLKIWGRINSTNVKKVVWAAEELGLPYERIDAGRQFGVVNTPEYRALNPNGLVPTIDDDGFVLWESNAILRYLASKAGAETLYPSALHPRAEVERWLDWQTTALQTAVGPALHGLIRTPEAERNLQAIEAARQKTETLLPILEARLSTSPYLVGEQFTLADLAVGCTVHLWFNLPLPRVPHPALEAWYAGLRARPASREALALPLS
ncbi:glutathione S-transferase family protein [Crenobacter sp. SG2305]|uniref:glutathione S-transferase family protein n=1 Tax=Crenobacter oryzisoli TaxID=3056844 RepID=UPI0025AAAE35|nr:glutathione S-transferase family protein [Crenobacter sp. SG2305]MDN0082686.1 glutathione S-transferase family protein [Crenobacter sp. SG2305]